MGVSKKRAIFLGAGSDVIVNALLASSTADVSITYDGIQRDAELGDISTDHIFENDVLSIRLADICGHRRFSERLIRGLIHIDTAVVIFSSLESSAPGAEELLHLLRVSAAPHIIFCFLDNSSPEITEKYDTSESYEKIISDSIQKLGYSPLTTSNLHIPAHNAASGVVSLLQEIENYVATYNDSIDPSEIVTRMINSTYELPGKKKIVGARIASGTLLEHHKLYFSPGDFNSDRVVVRWPCNSAGIAYTGDHIGITVDGRLYKKVTFGSLMSNHPLNIAFCNSFTTCLYLLKYSEKLSTETVLEIDIHGFVVEALVVSIKAKLNKRQFTRTFGEFSNILPGESATVELKPLTPVCIIPYSLSKAMGLHIYKIGHKIIAHGLVTETH